LTAASATRRQNEIIIAQAVLARAGGGAGDGAVTPDADRTQLSARARSMLNSAM
jgi:hypothetical protein